MPQDHRLQLQRFELKYLVPESRTNALRDFLQSYLELDDYTAHRPDRSYDVHSVYLDSEGLHTHHATLNGDKNRFKLRLRYYTDHPDAPWHDVDSEDKRRARINMIAHLISTMPYHEVQRVPLELPGAASRARRRRCSRRRRVRSSAE